MKSFEINVLELKGGDSFITPSGTLDIIEELGQGGFATVYKALYHGKEVALKIVKMWNIMPHDRKEYLFRLEQEFNISKKFNSPHVIKMQAYDQIKGNPYLIMELCPNGSLRDRIDKRKVKDGEKVALAILKGLYALHQEGIIHRDIKPENILFGPNEEVKLVDFGISGTLRNRVTKPNIFGAVKEVFATVAYSPPEQTDPLKAFKSLAPALDIYAFGITMYEYFTAGSLPFGSFENFEKDLVKFNKIKNTNGWDKEKLVASLGNNQWVSIIEKCIKAKPADRFHSTKEILDLLDTNISSISPSFHKHNHKSYSNWILEIMQGDELGRKYYLNILALNFQTKVLTLGWLDLEHPFANHIGVTEVYTNYISTHHATLTYDDLSGSWLIQDGQDLGDGKWKKSKNGVIHNGIPIGSEPSLLHVGDILSVGFTTMKVIAI